MTRPAIQAPRQAEAGRTRLLVTGFGPFPGVRKNPTASLMRLVAERLRRAPGLDVAGGELTVRYASARAELAGLIARHAPDAILLLGLASRARWIRVERHARLLDSPLHPDAEGRAGGAPAGPTRPLPTLPLKAKAALEPALAQLRGSGFRARLSPSAGRYLCNAVYAAALADPSPAAARRSVLFVHVPWTQPPAGCVPKSRAARWKPEPLRLAAALGAIACQLAREARRAGMGQSPLA
jgi:pyroglutamyl-peptidase